MSLIELNHLKLLNRQCRHLFSIWEISRFGKIAEFEIEKENRTE